MLPKHLFTGKNSHYILCIKLWLTLYMLSAGQRIELQIGGFFPVSANLTKGAIGRGVIPAVRLALEHINDCRHILTDYKLTIQWNDTQCDPAVGMKNFFDMLSRKTHKVVALFGAACTTVTDPIAKAAQFFQLVQLTYADTHPMYRMENYPNLFRVVPSEAAFNPARVALLQYFNWTRVGTLYQNSPRYALPHSKLLTALETAKIDIAAQHGFVDELTSAILKLKEKDVRIILGNFDQSWAGQIFCEAYRVGLYGRKYQWIIVGMYDDYWWRNTGNNITCDKFELQEALEGYIATDVLPLSTDGNITVSGLVPSEYEAQYNKGRRKNYSRFHGYAYDGIWAIALAMQKVRQKLMSEKSGKSLEMFEYKDPMWVHLFREALNKTSFLGVTGPVSFIRNERRGLILLKQFQGGTEKKIGEYDSIANNLDLSKGTTIKWRGDTDPPMDRTLIVIERTRISVTVYSLLVTFSILGILLASVFLVVNIRYRNQRNIKMSSPYLNNLIIVGCMLTYTSVILLGMDSGLTSEKNFPYICAGRAWVLMSGFTLAFGSMFSKTWRVHAIFTDIKLNKKAIKDYKLFMVVGVLMMIDVAILTTWQIIDPFYRRTSLGPPMPSTKKKDVVIIPEMEFCQSEKMTIFLGSTYAYKGLLMAFGCFLAWETRHVSIPALNDSKYVGMSVYNVVIMCVIGAAISFVLRDKQDAAFVIISVFIIFCSTTTLCLVFVPKLVELRRNTDSGDVRTRATLKPFKSSRRNSDDEIQNKIKILENQNCRQKQILNEKTIELQTLVLELKEVEEPLVMIKHAITTIPENSSSSADSSYENLSQVVTSYIIKEEESFNQTSHPNKEDLTQCSLPWNSEETIGTDVEHTTQTCCTHQNESNFALAPLTPEVRKITFKENNLTTTIEMHPLSVTQKISQTIKYMDSESESSSESSSLPKSISPKDGDVRTESDDTSYTRAIRSFHQRVIVNGMSSSCDEDMEELGSGVSQKVQDSSSHNRKSNRERAKSLGTLHPLTTTNSGNPCDPCVSVIHTRRTDGGVISPLFPYLNRTVNDDQTLAKYSARDHTAPMYSSFPSVKCDIVEYL
ncbi:gamma-aminobutyric acid type B receptor subunit 2-like [Limulus polyphemus]|uniref:Gamma-aminobutyric acid type B receptor subunit 2-like n=1 Tax=Limulus polyphemus TaxID=6850 RepID=A0ABM1S9Z8_LIMPO|nr:gamma-aminobutyric acid type B receptor subunit 2-like [Limulus polyphemus]